MTDDIVYQIRRNYRPDTIDGALPHAAADEIERLRAENQHLENLIHDLLDQLPPQPNYLAEAQQAIRKAARQ